MGLIKKIDVPRYFAARRALRLGTAQGLSRPTGTRASKAGSDITGSNAETFTKDFSLEHSSSSALLPPGK